MNNLLNVYRQYTHLVGWIPSSSVILLITAIIFFAQRFIISVALNRSKIEKNLYLNTILTAIRLPLSVAVWGIGIVYVALDIRDFFDGDVEIPWLDEFYRILLILSIAWFLKRLINRLQYNLSNPKRNKTPVDKTTSLAISRLFTVFLAIITVLVIMQTLDINVTGIITLGSAGTLVLGFAAKDMLANFFGGFMIFTDRPFSVGDWVRSKEKNIEGYVEHVGWRNTQIRTLDKNLLFVPNSTFLTISIENPSRMSHRRIKHTFGLRYSDSDKIVNVCQKIEDYLRANQFIDQKEVVICKFKEFSESSLDCEIVCFTTTKDRPTFMKIQQDILNQIFVIVKQNGADMAFPTRTIEMVKN